MTTTRQRLTAAIEHVEWLIAPPHALHSVIGIYAEVLAGKTVRFRHGATPEEMAAAISRRLDVTGGHGKGGHSDPTFDAAFGHTPEADDGDETVRQMRTAETDLVELTYELAGRLGASTTTEHRGLHAVSLIAHRCLERLDDDPTVASIVSDIADTAAWLHEKALWIWQAAKGEALPVAEQKPIEPCRLCGSWRKGTVAVSRGRCEQCTAFQDHHKCKPTEAIVRRWEATGTSSTPPGMILEAKAHGRKRARSAG